MNTKDTLFNSIKELLQKFTVNEIREALNKIEEMNIKVDTNTIGKNNAAEFETTKINKKKHKAIHEQRSKAVLELKNIDGEKFKILSEFDLLIRKGELLPNIFDIWKLGSELNKDFPNNKSRRQLISQLMNHLVKRSTEDIRKIIANVISVSQFRNNGYQRLAKFIISGNKIDQVSFDDQS